MDTQNLKKFIYAQLEFDGVIWSTENCLKKIIESMDLKKFFMGPFYLTKFFKLMTGLFQY